LIRFQKKTQQAETKESQNKSRWHLSSPASFPFFYVKIFEIDRYFSGFFPEESPFGARSENRENPQGRLPHRISSAFP
jgi:hypothetical protein